MPRGPSADEKACVNARNRVARAGGFRGPTFSEAPKLPVKLRAAPTPSKGKAEGLLQENRGQLRIHGC